MYQEDRAQFIENILQQRKTSVDMSYSDVNIADIASKTEGYVFRDMETLIDRAIHVAVMARMQQTSCNFNFALLLLLQLSAYLLFTK